MRTRRLYFLFSIQSNSLSYSTSTWELLFSPSVLFPYFEMRTRSLKVIDMAVHDVATITADKNIQECAAQMRSEHVGSLVVINDERKPIGMITDSEIAFEVVAL